MSSGPPEDEVEIVYDGSQGPLPDSLGEDGGREQSAPQDAAFRTWNLRWRGPCCCAGGCLWPAMIITGFVLLKKLPFLGVAMLVVGLAGWLGGIAAPQRSRW